MRLIPVRLILIFIILSTIGFYFEAVTRTCILRQAKCFEFRESIANGTAVAPFRYRILGSALETVLTGSREGYDWWTQSDFVLHSIGVVLLYLLLWRWLRRWATVGAAFGALAIFALAFNLSFYVFLPTLTPILELILLTAMLLTLDKSYWWSVLWVVLATLNRETGLLLIGAYAVYHGRSQLKFSLVLLVIWAAIQAALHLKLGPAPHMYGLVGTWNYNTGNWMRSLVFNFPFIMLWIAFFKAVPQSTPLFKRFGIIALMYAAAVLVGGSWEEIRLWLPILVLLLPVLFNDKTTDANVPLPVVA